MYFNFLKIRLINFIKNIFIFLIKTDKAFKFVYFNLLMEIYIYFL